MPTSQTVSTCVPETEQGTHVFDIFGYSQHRGIGASKPMISGEFHVGGHSWHVLFYPDGLTSGDERYQDCISVGLALASQQDAKVRASYELQLVDQSTGSPVPVYKAAPRVFSRTADNRGGCWFVTLMQKRSAFERSAYLRDDHLTIRCVVTVIKEPRMPKTKSFPQIEVQPSNIAEHFAKLLEENERVDVNFRVGGESFAAHRMVLAARSTVFRSELYGPRREAGTLDITIKDVRPDVFDALLHFIYTDSLPEMDDLDGQDQGEMIRQLLAVADRHAVDRLKLMCESILCKNLHVQNVAATLALADQHHCDMLKDACVEFITSSNAIEAAVSTEGYKKLKRTCPSVLIDAFEKTSRFRKE